MPAETTSELREEARRLTCAFGDFATGRAAELSGPGNGDLGVGYPVRDGRYDAMHDLARLVWKLAERIEAIEERGL